MNYSEISNLAGPDVARKLQDSDFFDNHIAGKEKPVDMNRIDELIRGAVVLKTETVDYPLTDGFYIFLKLRSGTVTALYIEQDSVGEFGRCPVCGEEFYVCGTLKAGRVDIV